MEKILLRLPTWARSTSRASDEARELLLCVRLWVRVQMANLVRTGRGVKGNHTCVGLRVAHHRPRLGNITRGESWLSVTLYEDVEFWSDLLCARACRECHTLAMIAYSERRLRWYKEERQAKLNVRPRSYQDGTGDRECAAVAVVFLFAPTLLVLSHLTCTCTVSVWLKKKSVIRFYFVNPALSLPYLVTFESANAKVGAERNRHKTEVIYYVSVLDNTGLEWKINEVRALTTVATTTRGNITLGFAVGPRRCIADQLLAKADALSNHASTR